MKRFQQESRERHNDFVECLVFSNSTGVIMTGRYTDGTEPNKVTIIILYIAVTMLYIVVTMLYICSCNFAIYSCNHAK